MISKANVDFSARSEAALGVAAPPRTSSLDAGREPSVAGVGLFGALARFFARLSDAQLALFASVLLFGIAAWPLALVQVPPLQDLPNHLAAITIINHPERYPDFVSNGFLKTNTALFAWLYFVGKGVGLQLAARLFVLVVLAATALVLPRFVLELTGSRSRMVVASFFAWPFVHNWFVSMGMLDYALGFPLSLLALLLLERQRKEWTWPRAAAIGLVAIATWYAHVFTLMIVMLLVGLHFVTGLVRGEGARALRLVVPFVPAGVLVGVSLFQHMTEPGGAMQGFVSFAAQIPPWELAYNLWAEWLWGFTKLSITSFAVAIGLAWFAVTRRRETPSFFGPVELCTLFVLYLLLPYIATNWFHVNSRLIPYLWVAALLRVTE